MKTLFKLIFKLIVVVFKIMCFPYYIFKFITKIGGGGSNWMNNAK